MTNVPGFVVNLPWLLHRCRRFDSRARHLWQATFRATQWTGRVVPIFSRRIRLLLTIHSNFQVCLHVIRGFVKKNSKILAPYPLGGAVFGRHFFLSIFSTLEVWKAPFFAGYDPKMISPPQFRFLRFTKSCRIRKSSFPVAVADRTNLVLRVRILQFWRFRLRLSPFFSP